jgi:protein LTV1
MNLNLATYSNLENHPRIIRVKNSKSVPKISLDPKTGLPFVDGLPTETSKRTVTTEEDSDTETENTGESPL